MVNDVRATFRFRDGLIAEHDDAFSFHTWARQALGPPGLLLGWTPILRASVRRRARGNLEHFMAVRAGLTPALTDRHDTHLTHANGPHAGDATVAAPRGHATLGALASSMGNAGVLRPRRAGTAARRRALAVATTGAAQNDDSRPVMRLLAQTVQRRAAGRAAGSPAVLPRQHRGPPRPAGRAPAHRTW